MAKGDLKTVLRATRPRRSGSSEITKKRMVLLGADIAEGMEYLSSVSIVHRDLAARNCLVSDSLNAKVRPSRAPQSATAFCPPPLRAECLD